MDAESITVVNNSDENRFEVVLGNDIAMILYKRVRGDRIIYYHTQVPEAFGGKGIGSKLVRGALDWARENKLRVIALCPFVAGYVQRHEEYQDIVHGYELLKDE